MNLQDYIEIASGKDHALESLAKDIAQDRAYSASGFLNSALAQEYLALSHGDRDIVHAKVKRLQGVPA